MTRIPLVSLVPLLGLLAAGDAYALTTGSIVGEVVDSDGLDVPSVEVTLSSPDGVIGGDLKLITDDAGKFTFVELLPGNYNVTANKDGFKASTVTGIQVLVNTSVNVKIEMEVGGAEEHIEVIDKREAVDVDNVTRGEVLTKDFLQKLPTGRSYQSAVQQAAGVVGGGGGNPNMAGAASNENTYMLDGVNITDPVTGTFSLNFNYDAIQQIEVLLGGYEPEYGTSLGGVVNVITDSGTNNLEYNVSAYYENGNWAPKMDARYSADGFVISPTGFDSSWQTYSIGSLISGPVVRDKAWFFFSYQNTRSLYSNIGVELPRDYDGHYVLGKLTAQPTSEHRLTAFMQLDPTTIDNQTQAIRVKPEAQSRQAQGGGVVSLRWQWFLSPEMNLDTSFVTQKSYLEGGGVPCTHDRKLGYNPCKPGEQEGTLDIETPGRFGQGGAYDSVNYYYYSFDDRWRYNANTKLQVLSVKDPLGGSHDMKFGAEATQTTWHWILGYAGNAYYVDRNLVPYDPGTFENYYWIESTGPWNFTATGSEWNLFAQDAWKPVDNLTIKYGTRYDHTIQRNDIGEPVVSAGLFGPRAYAAWDPFGDQKTKIAGGYGRFNDTGRLGVSSFTSVNSIGSKLYFGEGLKGDDGQGFLNNTGLMYDIAPRSNPNLANDKLRTPRVDEFILLFQRELVEDVALGVNLSEKMTRYLYEQDELNVIYDEDGSAIIGARDGNPLVSIQRLRTPQIAKRNYFQGDVYLDKVESRRWAARLTYTYAQSNGSSSRALSGSFLNDPQTKYNYGRLYATDLTHQVKGRVWWDLPTDPWKQTIGATVSYFSGNTYERYYWYDGSSINDAGYGIRIAPRGVYGRLPGWWDVRVQFGQDIDVRKGKVNVSVAVLNALNFQQPVDVDFGYIASDNRNFVGFRQDPMSVQLGAEYQF